MLINPYQFAPALPVSVYAGYTINGFNSDTFTWSTTYTGTNCSAYFNTFPYNTSFNPGMMMSSQTISYNISQSLDATNFQVRYTLLNPLPPEAYASGNAGLGWLDGGATQSVFLNATARGTYSLQVQTELRKKYEDQAIISTKIQTIILTIS